LQDWRNCGSRTAGGFRMIAPLMTRQVIVVVCAVALYGILVAGLSPGVDASPWAHVLWAGAAIAVPSAYCSLLAPRGARARLLRAVDPAVGPPPGAQPVDSPLIRHLDRLSADKDYDALRSMLSDDFAMIVGRLELGASSYIRSLRSHDRRQPGQRTTEEVVVHPDEPDLLWVRSTHCRKPRFGPAYVSTIWTRVRVTSDGSRVREILPAGVLQVA
jgi:hypothetical protein